MAAPVRLGIAGFGVAAQALLPFLAGRTDVVLTAVADPDPGARAAARAQVPGCATCTDVVALCERADVDAVYVATPTPLHAAHGTLAAACGKAVVVEKPIAVALPDALALAEATEKAGVPLIVGHSQSFEAPVRAMRDLIDDGSIGPLCALNAWYYTDWIYRPRHRDELDPERGGGVTMRQAAHHIDIVRTLGGGLLRSVRAMTGVWDTSRRADGSYSAYLEFEDGTPTTLFYSGYDHFPSAELTFGIGEAGQLLGGDYATARRRLRGVRPEDEATRKTSGSAGESRQAELLRGGAAQPFFGLLIASCERADVRVSPPGLLVYDDDARREIPLPNARRGRDVLLDELVGAVRDGVPAQHDGRWGIANLEVCLAIRESARLRQEIPLRLQVPFHPAGKAAV
jgi:phthalate 4,5-cis-dihydrodiol dehydrogenase